MTAPVDERPQGQDPKGLEAKPASAVTSALPTAGAPPSLHDCDCPRCIPSQPSCSGTETAREMLDCRFCHSKPQPVTILVHYDTPRRAGPHQMVRIACRCGAIGKCRPDEASAVASWNEPWQALALPSSPLLGEGLVERLHELMAKADVLPLAYRPDKYDDWGTIRGGGVAFEPDHLHFIALVRDSRVDHDSYPAHREAGTDPYEAVTRFIVEGLNALPALLAPSPASTGEIEELRKALGRIVQHIEEVAADQPEARPEQSMIYNIARAALASKSPPPIMGEGLEVQSPPEAVETAALAMAKLIVDCVRGTADDIRPRSTRAAEALIGVAESIEEMMQGGARDLRDNYARIREAAALATPSSPEGMVMVPTDEMVERGARAMLEADDSYVLSTDSFPEFEASKLATACLTAALATSPASALPMDGDQK